MKIHQKKNIPLDDAVLFKTTQTGLKVYKFPNQNFNQFEEAQAKVLMVVGQTGSGKSTLLNFFINFIMGIKF